MRLQGLYIFTLWNKINQLTYKGRTHRQHYLPFTTHTHKHKKVYKKLCPTNVLTCNKMQYQCVYIRRQVFVCVCVVSRLKIRWWKTLRIRVIKRIDERCCGYSGSCGMHGCKQLCLNTIPGTDRITLRIVHYEAYGALEGARVTQCGDINFLKRKQFISDTAKPYMVGIIIIILYQSIIIIILLLNLLYKTVLFLHFFSSGNRLL